MFDLVPFAGTREKVAHGDCHAMFIRQLLQFGQPQAGAGIVAPAAIRGDQQFPSFWIALTSPSFPPTVDGGCGECPRVMIQTHADPPLVPGNVVRAIRRCLAPFFILKL